MSRLPGILRRWWVGPIFAVLLLVPFFVKIPKGLNNHPIIGPFGDESHVVLFIAITLLLYWAGPFRGRLWWAVGAAVVAGGAIEIIQIPFGRQAQFKDFLLDLQGIALVAALVLWRGDRRPWGRWAMAVILLTLPLYSWRLPFIAAAASTTRDRFPVIADFEGRYDGWLWMGNMASEFEVVSIDDGPDGPTRVMRLAGAPPINWPGILVRRFQRDWTGYHTLEADVRVVDGPDDGARLGLRLDDVPGAKRDVWISKGYDIDREWQTIRFRFADTELPWGDPRVFDHADLETIIFYIPKPQVPTTIEIDNVRLVPDTPLSD
jgi:hypothetical protein